MKKYYFIFYRCKYVDWPKIGPTISGTIENTEFTDIHPIQWQIDCNEEWGKEHPATGGGKRREEYMVIHWQEVTQEEYEKYKGWVG
jgi:hypothetical protein